MNTPQSFGEWLRHRRRELDLTQEALARQVGCARVTIRKLEADEMRPSKQLAELLVEQLAIPPEEREKYVRFGRSGLLADPTTTAPRHNLPSNLSSFIGRERELAAVQQILHSSHLVTLTGSGGIGKTRLALQTASELLDSYQDGVWWVELAALRDPALVVQTVAKTRGVREIPNQPLVETLAESLRAQDLLLVLDNCEHLISACAQLAALLLGACQNLKILATSREALDIPGETIWPVPSLSLPDRHEPLTVKTLSNFESIRLFADRARSVQPRFELTDQNAQAVVQICYRLDGIPLALELAAARITVLTLEEIAARLADRFTLLTHGSRTALPRHQTLRALIDWSYDLLSEPERMLWRRSSVFIGGWTLKAAESVCADDRLDLGLILEMLSRLIDKSLVIVEEQDGAARYRMLETIRQYGQEKLQAADEINERRTRHLEFFLQLAEQANPKLFTAEQGKWFTELDVEYSNLRAALEWAIESDAVSELRLAAALGQFWEVRGYLGEGRTAIERALQRAAEAPQGVRASGLRWQAQLAARQGDLTRAKEPIAESLDLSRRLGDKSGIASSLRILGNVLAMQGDSTAAQTAYEECLSLLSELGDKREIASVMTNLGNLAARKPDYATARRYQEESAVIFRELGDKFGLVLALNNLGVVAEMQGDNAAARRLYEESITTAHELGEKTIVAYALNGLAHVVYLQGEPSDAQRYYRESLVVFQEIGDKRGIAYCLEGFAKVAARYGSARQAACLLGAAEALRQAIGASLAPVERAELDQDVIVAQERLGKKDFEVAWAEGHRMTLEQAVDFALQP